MLDFSNLIDHVGSLAAETARRADVRREQMQIALECIAAQSVSPERHAERLLSARQRWLKAQPANPSIGWRDVCPAPRLPDCYTALACDGSQIPLDRHEIAPFYLLNVGKVALHYGCGSRPMLASTAVMAYRDEELLGSGEPLSAAMEGLRDERPTSGYVSEKELAARRFLMEMETLGEMIAATPAARKAVAFVDGTLILWTQESEQKSSRDLVLGRFLTVLKQARGRGVPIIGYLSRPASREVIGALRLSLCAERCVAFKECQVPSERPCAAIDSLTDADLFTKLLRQGERTPLFHSESRILDSYTPGEQRILFFYLNVGGEIARVELPCWCAEDKEMLELCHSVALDQAAKGFGYPVCLSEAHEQAVVRGPEREALLRLIEREFVRSNLSVARTAKAAAKRRRSV